MSLRNKIIINTRPASDSDVLTDLFKKDNSKVYNFPMIEIVSLASWIIREHIKEIGTYKYLVFTSANGVDLFFKHHQQFGELLPPGVEILCIGKKTADTLKRWDHEASLVSSGNTSKDFLAEIKSYCNPKSKILLTLGRLAPDFLRNELSKDYDVYRIDLYDTVKPKKIDEKLLALINRKMYDMILLTSPSGVNTLKDMLGSLRNHRFACIGVTTAGSLERNGGKPLIIAERSTSEGLYDAVKRFYQKAE